MLTKVLNKFKPKAAPAVDDDEGKSVAVPSNGFFSTDARRKGLYMTYDQRHAAALPLSIQKEIGDLVAVDAEGYAMDSGDYNVTQAKTGRMLSGYLPIQQFEWYAAQGFIGWQQCAILAQNWLIAKACAMPGKDAMRHGWEIAVNDGAGVSPEILDEMRRLDKKYQIKKQGMNLIKNGRIFGIRHALFIIDGIDYEAPFNPDGIQPRSYRGISQIDPYWMAPELDGQAAGNPSAQDFYEPTWWRVNGKRIHRSHFIIYLNDGDVPDLLKPSYIYGGISVPQKIYERVYAAERTANEAPMLAMTKRLTVLAMDTSQAMKDMAVFNEKMDIWTTIMNNFGVKVIGKEAEEVTQFETSLADLDSTIMTQYQLVAAGADVPATKLLGTTPKGFNATGEYDEASYHEELESLQENNLTPLLDRHYICMIRSDIAPKYAIKPFNVDVAWYPVDSPTAKELAETNKIKAETDNVLVTAGAIDGFDVRQRLISDPFSGYNGMPDVVPGGPGDRDFEREQAEKSLEGPKEESAMDGCEPIPEVLDPTTGMLGDARIITHQRYLNNEIVEKKFAEGDFVVNLTPVFEDEGKKYRMVIDGHHSLAAALMASVHPVFVESVPRDVVFNPVTGEATDEKDTD